MFLEAGSALTARLWPSPADHNQFHSTPRPDRLLSDPDGLRQKQNPSINMSELGVK